VLIDELKEKFGAISENGERTVDRDLPLPGNIEPVGEINHECRSIQGMENESIGIDSESHRPDSDFPRTDTGDIPASTGAAEQRYREADCILTSINGGLGAIPGSVGTRGSIQETVLRETAASERISEDTQ
jgi:hypothetical protein